MEVKSAGARPASIMLVDADEHLMRVLSVLLGSLGMNVRAFSTGFAALQSAKSQAPDVVLSELHLPDMRGVEFAACMRTLGGPRRARIVAHTDTSELSGTDRVLFDGLVEKPASIEALAREIARQTASDSIAPPAPIRSTAEARAGRARRGRR